MKRNEKGFGAVEGLLVLVIVALIGFVGWYVWHGKNTSSVNSFAECETAVYGEVRDQMYRPTCTYKGKTFTNPTPSVPKEVQSTKPKANTVSLKIGGYILELKVPDTLKDLAVGSSRDSTFEGKDFTQITLATDKFKNCSTPGGVLGSIYKVGGTYSTYPFGTPDETEGVYVKQLDSFYLMYQGPQSYQCGDLDATSTHAQVKQAIIDNGWTHKTK